MSFGLVEILQVFGAVAIFIFGMKMMSESIQRAAGAQFRQAVSNITSSKWLGLLSGLGITALIQSSSATTVMIVSFVNAGLMTVTESVGLILGANIGTTITGWIVSVLGFKVVLSNYAVPIFGVGVPLLFINRGKWKFWGEFLIGFAILFIGLAFLREAVPVINDDSILFEWLRRFTGYGIYSRLFFVLVGTIIAIMVQSSSVAMAVTLTMAAQGWLPIEVAASLILGENIGTTSTAFIASIVGNSEAKNTARVHFYFNLLGVLWMVFTIPLILPLLGQFLSYSFGINDVYGNAVDMTLGLSAFHTVFNLINALIFINFIPFLVKIASYGLPTSEVDYNRESKVVFLESTSQMPEMASLQLQKEVRKMAGVINDSAASFHTIINSSEIKKQTKLIKKIKHNEDITDQMEIQITEYITRLSREEVSSRTSNLFKIIISVCSELEQIADIYRQLATAIQRKMEENTYFLPEQRDEINQLNNLIVEALNVMNQNLQSSDYTKLNLKHALELEHKINTQRDTMRNNHLAMLNNVDYNIKSGMAYTNVFTSLERIADHIYNVTQTLAK